MADISLVKQLSGKEALDSMLFELRKKLTMNGRFQSHMAYPGYRAEVSVKFYPAASYIPPIEQFVEIEHIPVEVNGNIRNVVVTSEPVVDETVEIPIRPPNQVREDSDMPTPVMTMDEHGQPVEKWMKRKGRPPKNKIVGNNLGPEPAVTMVPTAIPVL